MFLLFKSVKYKIYLFENSEKFGKNLKKSKKWGVPEKSKKGQKRAQKGSETRSSPPLDTGFYAKAGGSEKTCFFGKFQY